MFDRADVAAERCFSTDVAMAYDYANLSWKVHVYDITINKIDIIKVSEFGSVMFQPYSIYRKDETETVSHSLITKFETKKKITNLRQWPGPLLQNF